jgi:hypothetical protein
MKIKRIFFVTVTGCARCGKNHRMKFKQFRRNVDGLMAGKNKATHFAICRNSGEPVIMAVTEDE